MIGLFYIRSTKPESELVCSLYSETYPEVRIGYREWVRGSSRPGDIHSGDGGYDHDVDELTA